MNIAEAVQDPSFSFGSARKRRNGREKGKSPQELFSPTAIRRAGPATRTSILSLTEESVMGITAWIAVGVAAGLLANMLLPGKRSRGFIFICLTCFTGALGGDWAAS